MTLRNDYFLLYHGSVVENIQTITLKTDFDDASLFQGASLILATSRETFKKFHALSSFHSILNLFTNVEINTLDELMQLQSSLIELLFGKLNEDGLEAIFVAFDYLKDETLISSDNHAKLITLFDNYKLYIEEVEKEAIQEKSTLSFIEKKNNIKNLIEELKANCTQSHRDELEVVTRYLDEQKFSIGITGVMNAGKSTMLNALLKKDILGTSVIPETANLTILRHSKVPKAKVFYWNSNEWKKIEHNAKESLSLQTFVKQAKEIYGEALGGYILEDSKYDEIDPKDLSLYTSAEKSNAKCNLVKYVELGVDLDFLSNNIEIVDTPGLDDPVIQREEITKEYVTQCDLMIHLMNVNQSATHVDIAFIIDSILYQNVTKLLIVISRADTVSKDELNEVINYTKTSIRAQLHRLNKSAKLDYILSSIKFIPISGYMALLHRIGKAEEALAKGYSLEDTNILQVEAYLTKTLFGEDNQKSELIIKSANHKLFSIIENQIKRYHYQINLMSKSKEELEEELQKFNLQKSKNRESIKLMQNDIDGYGVDMKNYLSSLESFIASEMYELKEIIKQRVFDNVKYSLEREKKRAVSSRIVIIIETAIKDGILDIIRDFRYKFSKKTDTIAELCEKKYKKLGFELSHEEKIFDSISFFNKNFKMSFLTANNEALVTKFLEETSKTTLKNLPLLNEKLDGSIKNEFAFLEENISSKVKLLSGVLIDDFFQTLQIPLDTLIKNIFDEERILEKQIEESDMKERDKTELSIRLHKKIQQLRSVQKRFSL